VQRDTIECLRLVRHLILLVDEDDDPMQRLGRRRGPVGDSDADPDAERVVALEDRIAVAVECCRTPAAARHATGTDAPASRTS